jgi:hypothetical protein
MGAAHSPCRAGHQRDGVLHAVHRVPPENLVSTGPTLGSPATASALVFPVSGQCTAISRPPGTTGSATPASLRRLLGKTGSEIEENTSDEGDCRRSAELAGGDAARIGGDRGDR